MKIGASLGFADERAEYERETRRNEDFDISNVDNNANSDDYRSG